MTHPTVTQADVDVAQSIVSGARGYGVKFAAPFEHSASILAARHRTATAASTAARIEALEGENAKLREELRLMTEHYVSLAGCGDCGHWNPEEEPEVIQARAALTATEGEGA